MKKVTLFGSATVTSVLVAGAIATPVFACHPVGSIIKTVQDQTTGSGVSDANTTTDALTVNSGDTLVYTVTVKNSGASASNGDNDMSSVTLTDNLPASLQLVNTDGSANMGTIKPGQSVTVKYAVKVTDTTNGDVITNEACYTGKSKDNNDNQSGCDKAIIKVNVPVTPTPTPKPVPTPQPNTPATLPDTGSTALSASLFVAGTAILAYALNLLRLKLRGNA